MQQPGIKGTQVGSPSRAKSHQGFNQHFCRDLRPQETIRIYSPQDNHLRNKEFEVTNTQLQHPKAKALDINLETWCPQEANIGISEFETSELHFTTLRCAIGKGGKGAEGE